MDEEVSANNSIESDKLTDTIEPTEIKKEETENVISSTDMDPLTIPSTDSTSLEKSSNLNKEAQNSVKKEKNDNGEKNAQKRIQTDSDNGNGKKPRTAAPTPELPNENVLKGGYEIEYSDDVEEYYLTIYNLPNDWSYVQIKNYLDRECGHVDEMEMINQEASKNCAIRLTFPSSEKCKEAHKKLKDKVVEDKILELEITEPLTSFPPPPHINKQPLDSSTEDVSNWQWRPDQDMWATDPKGLYGLRPQFLKSLDISPPIDRWVHVTNFRCDKAELKEVMELAGNVLMCCVVSTIQKYAKVMYSHPLEAVQAISMLNGQMYYGKPLKVSMDRNPEDTFILPKGLANIGLGLGLQGRPVRSITHQYHRFIKNQSSLINPIAFSRITIDETSNDFVIEEDNEEEIKKKINDFVNSTLNNKQPNKGIIVKNVDDMDSEPNLKVADGSTENAKGSPAGSRKSSVGSLSPSQAKNGPEKANVKPLSTAVTPSVGSTVPIRLSHPQMSPRGFSRATLLHNPAGRMPNPPVPTPGHPNYRAQGNFGNQPRPCPAPFGPRPPFMHGPNFGPRPMPAPFPAPGIRPQIPPANFSGPRPFVGPNPGPRPVMNLGNSVTVQFSNLPPSTTFPLLCEKLASCGQVMSVQLTTPGCAVATFGHPSHAERCFQTFNRMNVDGYIIEVNFT